MSHRKRPNEKVELECGCIVDGDQECKHDEQEIEVDAQPASAAKPPAEDLVAAARSEALEEAARIVDGYQLVATGFSSEAAQGIKGAAKLIALDIRELKGKSVLNA